MEHITVLTAVDDNYVLPLSIMMRSLLRSLSPEANVDFRLLTSGLSRASRGRIDRSIDGLNTNVQEITIDPSPLEGLKVSGHISLETYFRLLAPQYVEEERVLYLDADMIVLHSVLELYRLPVDGAHLLAVPHASKRSGFFGAERGVPSFATLGIPGSSRTFNAGVMMLNLEAWRTAGTTNSILRYLRDYQELVLWWDQDGLNAVLHDKWRPLPAKWNVMTSHFAEFDTWADSLLDEATFDAVKHDPAIIHYSYLPKPWTGGYTGPFGEHWDREFAAVASYFDRQPPLVT